MILSEELIRTQHVWDLGLVNNTGRLALGPFRKFHTRWVWLSFNEKYYGPKGHGARSQMKGRIYDVMNDANDHASFSELSTLFLAKSRVVFECPEA